MLKRNAVAMAISSLLMASAAQAATIYENENGDYLKLYGEVGVGGHIGANFEYGEFYTDEKSYIDDSFATMGVRGKNGRMHYRLELDYERENWQYGSGDLVLSIDKLFLGYDLLESNDFNQYIEVGLTDTAFDDYDKWGDFTFDTTVETGEAGDQDVTIKYEGRFFSDIKVGASYTYGGKSSSGSELGDIVNGYLGYFGERFSAVVGLEGRGGSDGKSKYGEQQLLGFGARFAVTEAIHLALTPSLRKKTLLKIKPWSQPIRQQVRKATFTTISKRKKTKVRLCRLSTSLPLSGSSPHRTTSNSTRSGITPAMFGMVKTTAGVKSEFGAPWV